MDKPVFTREGASSWLWEYYILTQRCFQQYYRRWDIILMNCIATVLIAVFIGFGFWNEIGKKQVDVRSYRPSLFFVMVNTGVVASLQAISTFPTERAIVLRERASGSYGVSSYFIARTTVDLIGTFWQPIIFSCIIYWAIDYQHNAGKFFLYMFFIMLNTWAATSLGCLVVCVCVSIERSTIILAFLFEVCRLFGGLYTNPKQLLEYQDWKFADALSYIKYSFVGVSLNEYHGLHFDTSTCKSGGACTRTGHDIVLAQGYNEYTIGECIGCLIALIVGFRFLAYLALRFVK
jgi:ATP-binding cassette subfamily G (WHITE) protein 2